MSYHSLTDLRPSDRTTYPPVEKTFYEVTFLGTVCLVYLNQENVCNISRVERIKNLMVAHFEIPLKAIDATFLLDVQSGRNVTRDDDLIYEKYFLALIKNGFELPLEEKELAHYPLITQPLFHRTIPIINIKERKQYELGRVEVLEAIRTIKKKKIGFVCPFIGCGKMFKRPWDVIAHFRVEVDAWPYQCQICQKLFRVKVKLTKHQKLCQKPETDQVKPEPEEKPRSLSNGESTNSVTINEKAQYKQPLRKSETFKEALPQIAKNNETLVLIREKREPLTLKITLEMWSRALETALILKEKFGIKTLQLN